jgi:hypothetical protein
MKLKVDIFQFYLFQHYTSSVPELDDDDDDDDDDDTVTLLEDISVVEDIDAEVKVLMALCFPVIFSKMNTILLWAVKMVTIKKAGIISEMTKNTKLNAELDTSAPVSTKIKMQCRRNAVDPRIVK